MHQKLGQHFLVDSSVAASIAEALAPPPGAVVVEIGPGKGALTRVLLARLAPRTLIAIERDPDLAATLRADPAFRSAPLAVRVGDARTELPAVSRELGTPPTPWFLVGNIPYYITGTLLRTLEGLEHPPERIVLTLQREVAERVAAGPPRMNLLAASVQAWASVRLVCTVPRGAFSPLPEVTSAVLTLTPRTERPPTGYFALVRCLFAQPRKTIRNSIADAEGARTFPWTRAALRRALEHVGISESMRAQSLSPEKIGELLRALGPAALHPDRHEEV
ncbi:MAG: 16S rRNA (adenine(1518)-N(6)/adenine(1519)-N(6))-dimethyltransferase RsmA [Patescibacteria group bacterium]